MDHQEQAPLIPLADRPLAPSEFQDSFQETLWHNPTDRDITLDMQHEMPVGRSTEDVKRPPRTWEEKTGKRRYVFKAGQTRACPADFDMAIHHTQCLETDCLSKPFECKDPKHEHRIIGGLAPQLVNKGRQSYKGTRKPDVLAPALDDAEARKRAADAAEFEQWQREKMAKDGQAAARAEKARAEADQQAQTANATGDTKPAKTPK